MKHSVWAAAAIMAVCPLSRAENASTVSVYGIIDAAVRYTTHAGATAATRDDAQKSVAPGGMSQSRLGVNVVEELGGGVKVLAKLEHRFNADTGTAASATDFWRQSWVGLQGNFGRTTLGRQYNVLFDVFTSTYASFKYSPYIEAFKPEIGFSLGARNDNMIKYQVEGGPWRGALQIGAGEGAATGGKSVGGYVRYGSGPMTLGGAYLVLQDGSARKATAFTAGGSYALGAWSLSAGWARNRFASAFNPVLSALLLGNGGANGTFASGDVSYRDLISLGGSFQVTPQLNLGVHYWHARQAGVTSAGDGRAMFAAAVADYALSNRTDLYAEIDGTRLRDGLTFSNTADSRVGAMVGIRHRF